MNLQQAENELRGRRVLVTGHTGFTGTWMLIWLNEIGAECYGLSFENTDEMSMSKYTKIKPMVEFIGDVADACFVFEVFDQVKPEYVLHLAAQPIVSVAYKDPFRTVMSNAQGTAVVLEACMRSEYVKTVVCVTTDKVYKNSETGHRFVESDELGGGDPYSASKSAAEHIISMYSQILKNSGHKLSLQVARGGNIVGGGDYSKDRIIPDLVRSCLEKKPINVRQPDSTRPWQHVLSLAHGYILLLAKDTYNGEYSFGVWNFGPTGDKDLKVSEIIEIFKQEWKNPRIEYGETNFLESHNLGINSKKAKDLLNWLPKWDQKQIFTQTISWYKEVHLNKENALDFSKEQLDNYRKLHFE
jgi:CDP-glucose 4,6-dehydratase